MIKELFADLRLSEQLQSVANVVKLAYDRSGISLYESESYKSLHIAIYKDDDYERHEFGFTGQMTVEEKEKEIKKLEDFRESVLSEFPYVTWEERKYFDETPQMSALKLSKTYEEANDFLVEISKDLDSPIKFVKGTELGYFPAVWANYVQNENAKYYTTHESSDDIF